MRFSTVPLQLQVEHRVIMARTSWFDTSRYQDNEEEEEEEEEEEFT